MGACEWQLQWHNIYFNWNWKDFSDYKWFQNDFDPPFLTVKWRKFVLFIGLKIGMLSASSLVLTGLLPASPVSKDATSKAQLKWFFFFFPLSFVSLWELNLICVFVCLFFKKNLIWKAEPSYSLEEAKGKWHKLIMMLIANYISTHSLYLVDNSCCLLQWAVSQTLHSCFKAFETAYVHCRNHYLNVERVGTVEIWTASFANGLGGKKHRNWNI